MALKNLSTETMIALSLAWLDPKVGRPTLEAHPRTSAYLPNLEAAYQGLLTACSGSESEDQNAELTALSAEQSTLDDTHDRKVRGHHLVLSGLAALAGSREEAIQYIEARDALLPEGIAINQRTYLDEAGNAALIARRLQDSPKLQGFLGQIPLPGGKTLLDETRLWLDTGERLGTLETRRIELLHERDSTRAGTRRGDILRARNQWSRVVYAIQATIDLDEHPAEDLEKSFLRPLREAETKADRRSNEPTPPDAPPAS